MSETAPSDVPIPQEGEETFTDQGAPRDQAHKDVGDGSSTGSVPAGLTGDELQKVIDDGMEAGGGTG